MRRPSKTVGNDSNVPVLVWEEPFLARGMAFFAKKRLLKRRRTALDADMATFFLGKALFPSKKMSFTTRKALPSVKCPHSPAKCPFPSLRQAHFVVQDPFFRVGERFFAKTGASGASARVLPCAERAWMASKGVGCGEGCPVCPRMRACGVHEAVPDEISRPVVRRSRRPTFPPVRTA